jgi:hypothetical protein
MPTAIPALLEPPAIPGAPSENRRFLVAVRKVRIHLPPAVSQPTFGSSKDGDRCSIACSLAVERPVGRKDLIGNPLLPMFVEVADPAGSLNLRRLRTTLAAAADAGPKDFAELLLSPGIYARTVRSLAMVAEVVHGAPYRFADPARFSLAHGGKDRHPFPVPLTVYDQTIRVLKTAVAKARLGREEELAALERLDDQARRLEGRAAGPDFAQLVHQEQQASHANGGRSVFGWEPPLKRSTPG